MRRLRHGRPALSLVVTAESTQPHLLRATLESACDQRTPLLEILVVCLDDDARGVAAVVAGADTRARILSAPTVSAARRLGARVARGHRLVLAAAGDSYLPGAVEAAVPLLGSPVPVLLAVDGDPPGPADLRRVPAVAGALRLGRLVLPARPDLPAGDDDPDGVRAAAGLVRSGFLVTGAPAYADARGTPPPPHSRRHDPLPGLPARAARDRDAIAALSGFDAAREHFAAAAVGALAPFLEAAEVASAEEWSTLSTHARDLLDQSGAARDAVDVVPRVLARLAAEGRRDDLIGLVAARRFAGADFPTRVVQGEVYADLGVVLDQADLVVGRRESTLRTLVRGLRVDGDRLVLDVLAGVRHVDQVDPPVVTAVLRDGDREIGLDVTVARDPALGRWWGESRHDHDHGLLRLGLPVDRVLPGDWAIALTWATDGLVREGVVAEIDHQGSAGRSAVLAAGAGVRLRRTRSGVRLVVGAPPTGAPTGDVDVVEVRGASLHVVLSSGADQVFLQGEDRQVDAVQEPDGTWTLPLAQDVWGLGERPLPTGSYRLQVRRGTVRAPATLAPAVLDRLPEEVRSPVHRVRLLRGPGDSLALRLEPLLADDESGPRAQHLLQAAYARVEDPLDPRLVYFQSFTGQWANDHPLAIQQELFRRRPDLQVRWVVADSSAPVPPGAEPVLLRSREWYDVLARAGHLVTNIELDRWFRRRPGQQILQTFHGYPSKTMGLALWRSRGLLPSHLQQQLEHTSGTWNALLTPDPAMDRYYRREYAYEGRILGLGYPRDDVLVGPDAEELRVDTRRRLGIAPGKRAVLYAPTWRDDLATNFRAAEAVHHLDVDRAADGLGDDYVLLLRGHRFHASTSRQTRRIIDVTSYPDVNHLILAADAAVLDYSSMRFDFALTGRPMVFLVPDIDDYGARTRGFLWDFGETAPGPWVRDTTGVVAELRDLGSLRSRWAEELVAFNARYNSLQDGRAAERVVADFFGDLPGTLSRG